MKIQILGLTISTNKDVDMRLYNTPASSEVAVLLPGDGMNVSNSDVVLDKNSGGLKRINEFNACYDPLHYILYFHLVIRDIIFTLSLMRTYI